MSPLLTHHFYFSIRKSNSYNSIQDLFWILLMGWLNQYYLGPFISIVISSLSEEWGASHSTSDYSSSPKIFDVSFMINTTSSVIYHSVGLYLRWCLFFFLLFTGWLFPGWKKLFSSLQKVNAENKYMIEEISLHKIICYKHS